MNRTLVTALLVMTFSLALTPVGASEQEDKSRAFSTAQAADTEVKRLTGQLTHIEGWHYTIKDSRGEEVSFGVTQATQDPDKVKEGDHILAMVGEDRIARVIRNMKKKS
jgi:hypothetical protein